MKEAIGQLQTCRVDYIWTYGQANEYVELIEGGVDWVIYHQPDPRRVSSPHWFGAGKCQP